MKETESEFVKELKLKHLKGYAVHHCGGRPIHVGQVDCPCWGGLSVSSEKADESILLMLRNEMERGGLSLI